MQLSSPLTLLEQFLHYDFVKRNADKAQALLSREIQWFGTGEDEDVCGIDEAAAYLLREIAANPTPYEITLLQTQEQIFAPGMGTVLAKARIVKESCEILCRISAACRLEDGVAKLCSMHFSVPNILQPTATYFPISSDEKHAQELLLKYLSTTSTWGILSWLHAPGFPLHFASCAMLKKLGYTSEEEFSAACGGLFENAIYPDDRVCVRNTLKEQFAKSSTCEVTYRLLTKSGNLLWVDDRGRLTKNADEKATVLHVLFDVTKKHEAAQIVLQKNQELNNVINSISGGIVLYRVGDTLERVYYSDGILSLIGCSRERFEQDFSNPLTLVYESDRARVHKALLAAITTGAEIDLSYRLCHQTGRYIWVRAHGKRVEQKDSETLLHVVLTNLSKETALHEDILNQMNEMILVSDCETHEVLFANRAAKVFGGQSSEFSRAISCHRFLYGLSTPCDNCRSLQFRKDALLTYEESYNGRYYRKQGKRLIWNGREAFVEYISDITDEHNKSVSVSRDRDMLIAAVHVMFPLCISVNLTQNTYNMLEYDHFNTRRAKERGEFDELIRTGALTIHSDDRKAFVELFSREALLSAFRSGKKIVSLAHRQLGDNNVWHWNLTSVVFVKNNYNDDVLEITYAQCIDAQKAIQETLHSREKQLEQALQAAEQANHSKSDFLSRMSHDIRTPMNAIIGMADIANDCPNLPEEVKSCIDTIQISSRFLLGLINDILDVSRIDQGKLVLNPEPYLLTELEAYLDAMIRPLCAQKGLTFLFSKCGLLSPCVFVDKVRLNQIFFNLLSNAVKYTPSGGTVELLIEHISLNENCVHRRILVRDNGIGMSEEFQRHMFEPFSQENSVHIRETQGSGLGLSIAQRIVELMGGTISVKSELGKGTEFCVELDFEPYDPSQLPAKSGVLSLSDLRGKRVLLCEDQPVNAKIAQRLLEKAKITVELAADGKEGVHKFEASAPGTFDAILMDIRMPVMDGLEATAAIRSGTHPGAKTIPIIAMTANAFDIDREKSLAAGMNAHLIKPIEPDKLYKTLAQLCTSAES